MIKKILLIASCFAIIISAVAQDDIPDVPVIKGYQGKEGKIIKYNFFNFLSITDKSGDNKRQSTGQYWEVSYIYDSAFRQKQKFGEYSLNHVKDNGGTIFFQDTSSLHFAIPTSDGNVWGKFNFTSNTVYKLKLIKEKAFENGVIFDTEQQLFYDDFVEHIEFPPRIALMPNSVITRAEQSKFHHYTFTYNVDKKTFEQKLMGPYWDIKLEVQNSKGEVDKRVSYIQIQESYYRAVLKSGGNIVKNRAREIVFNLPGDEYTIWARVSVTMDGVYFLRVIKQYPADYSEPVQLYREQSTDSLPASQK